MSVEGLMSTEKVISPHGELRIADETNKYDLVVQFDCESDKRSGRVMSMFKKGPKVTETGGLEHRKDLVKITIRRLLGYTEEIVAVGNGSFLEHIKYLDSN